MLAGMTGLRRWEPSVNLDQGTPIPLGFVLQLAGELTPSHITNRFGETVVGNHVLDRQALNTHHLVFVDDACTEFVLVVPPSISNLGVYLSNLEPCLGSILGAFLLLGKLTLGFCQFLLIFSKIAGIAYALTSRKSHHRLDTQVKPDHIGGDRQRLDVLGHQDRDEVAIGTIFGDGDTAWLAPFGKRAVEADIQRYLYLGKRENLPVPREGIGGIGSRLVMAFLFESRVVSSSFKEVHKGAIKMAKGLLKGNRRNLCQPGIVLLESGQHSRKIVVVEALSMLEIGGLTSRETPVVDEAAASERLSKILLLLIGRIEAILVGTLRLLAHSLLPFLVLNILFDDRERRSANGTDKIAVCPERRKSPLQGWKLLPQVATTPTLDGAYQPVNTELWITLDQQMHVIRLDIQAQDLCLMRDADLTDDLLQTSGYLLNEHLAPVLGTPHHMVLAGVVDVPVGLVGYFAHRDSIQYQAIYYQGTLLPHLPSHLKRNGPYIPVAEARGFTGRVDKNPNVKCFLGFVKRSSHSTQ
jgi:hypothetical protein